MALTPGIHDVVRWVVWWFGAAVFHYLQSPIAAEPHQAAAATECTGPPHRPASYMALGCTQ